MNVITAELLEPGMVMDDDKILSEFNVTHVEIHKGTVYVSQVWDSDGFSDGGTRVVKFPVGELVYVA